MIDIEIGVLMRVRPESELEIRVLLPAVESFHQDFPEAEFVVNDVTPSPARLESVVWEFWRAGFERSFHGESVRMAAKPLFSARMPEIGGRMITRKAVLLEKSTKNKTPGKRIPINQSLVLRGRRFLRVKAQ